MTRMTSNRPYLLRAFYDWIVDNQCTPYVVVDAYAPGVEVPLDYASDGQIVLNVAPQAVRTFHMDNDGIQFNTRFGGVPTDIHIPVQAVLGIYARENGQGMVFQAEEMPDPEPPQGDGPGPKSSGRGTGGKGTDNKGQSRPNLRVIK